MMAGQTPKRPNVLSEGSYFSGRKPEDGRIDFSQPAAAVYNLIRAVAPPYPGAFTDIGGRRFIVARARRIEPSSVPAGLKPGLHVVDGRIVAVGGDGGAIRVTQLLEGPNADNASPVSVQVFQNIITAKS
jgi:methionyl-tRNA formyltransferase